MSVARSLIQSRKVPVGVALGAVSYTHLDVYKRQLEDQLTAIDIQTGAGVARVAGDLYEGYSGRGGAGAGDSTGSLFAVGAAGLGLGLLFSNNRDNNSRSRRRR